VSFTRLSCANMDPQDLGIGSLFERIQDAVIVAVAKTQRIVLWNPAATNIFGYSASEALGLRVEDLVPESLKDQHRRGIAHYAETGHGPYIDSHRPLELPAISKGGKEVYVELSFSAIGPEGQMDSNERFVLAIIRDITDRKRMEEEVRRLNTDLEKRVAERTEQLKRVMAKQQEEAQERQRIEQELQVARLIQQTLLPKSLPRLAGYDMAAYYQPAREVGGDFYDFLELEDGRLGLVVGDVSGKGVPAAIVMAITRTMLHAAYRLGSPGEILEQVNNILCPDIPPNMFVTCLAALLDSTTGRLQYANAGHDLPYVRHADGVSELRARGMPLGLMPNMSYEQKEIALKPGESVLLYSDGLVEAHDPQREMFGFPRMQEFVGAHPGGASLIDFLLAELAQFTGEEWEQEDDIALLTLQRIRS
jgi:PAS domain S-box-containing protein